MFFQGKFRFIFMAAVLIPAIEAWSATATVTFSTLHQSIDGFGGSSAWEGTYSSALMDALYKNGSGQLGLTILRNRIDPHAGWASDKSNSAAAKARGAMVFATPWSPPESLKTNANVVKGYIDSSKFAGFVTWVKSYLNYCGPANIDIFSIENEPDYAQQITYEGCGWSASNFMKFCKTYAPEIGKPIMLPESFSFNFALSDATLNDSTAAKNVTYIGGHLYGSQPKTYTKAINLGKHVWMTEWNASDYSANGCMTLAKQILDCMYNSMNAYVYWWMTDGGNGIISSSGTPNKYGWVLASFSKWVRPGYIRVDATYNPQSGVYVVAFKGDSNVVVAVNTSASSQSVTFSYSGATVLSVNKYTSSQSKNAASDGAIAATNNSFTVPLDAQSVTTLVSAGTGVHVLPFGSEDGWYTVKPSYSTASPSNAAARFMYLINGKRCRVPVMNDQEMVPPGIYVVPGNAKAAIGAGKKLHDSQK